MGSMQNPFTPSFGVSPPLLIGRDDVLARFGEALEDGPGSPGRATLYTGARGTGRTVLLNAVELKTVSTLSARLGNAIVGSITWERRHVRHMARFGVEESVPPPRRRTGRVRAEPQGPSEPAQPSQGQRK